MHKIKQGFCGKVGEYMIFDELVVTINALDNLKKKTDLKNNKALQDNTDAKYRLLLSQTNSYISTIEYVYTNVPYAKNIEILTATLELLDNLEKFQKQKMSIKPFAQRLKRNGVRNILI